MTPRVYNMNHSGILTKCPVYAVSESCTPLDDRHDIHQSDFLDYGLCQYDPEKSRINHENEPIGEWASTPTRVHVGRGIPGGGRGGGIAVNFHNIYLCTYTHALIADVEEAGRSMCMFRVAIPCQNMRYIPRLLSLKSEQCWRYNM